MLSRYSLDNKQKKRISSTENKDILLKELTPLLPNNKVLRDDLANFSPEQLQMFYDKFMSEYQDITVGQKNNGFAILINFVAFSIAIFLGLKILFFNAIIDTFGNSYTSYFYMMLFAVIFGFLISLYLTMEMNDAIEDRIQSAHVQNVNNAFKIYGEINKVKMLIRNMDDLRRLSKLQSVESTIYKDQKEE